MPSEILISSDPWENRVAILEDGALAELYIEREERVIGSIYKGRVQNVLPGMGAAFVDIGLGRNAFLYVDDINKQPLNIGDVEITHGHSGFTINEKVKKGDDVLIQIVKEPRGLKGARISTNISLPGRYLILMPTGKYSGVSRKIESADERTRLKNVMQRIRPEGMATVVRTAAGGVSEAELIADLGVLIRMWHGILEIYKRAASPSLLHRDMNLVFKAARDFISADVDKVLIDNEDEYRKVREFLQLLGPQYLDRVEYYNSGRNLFDDYKITEELQKLMKPKINLPSGGSIVIETTEALTVIDVNSGKFTGGRNLDDTIFKTNIEAATELARQVRLRDIGGIVVVDFIDMSSESARSKVLKALEDGLRLDRTRATIQSFSNLGLLEFTRKRVGKDLGAQLRGACPTCAGLGTVMSSQSVAIETFRHIRETAVDSKDAVLVHAAPTVAAQMEYWYDEECESLAQNLGRPIHVRVDPMLHPEKSRVESVTAFKDDAAHIVRVGDEHNVELLTSRLPTATSAAAVVNDHLIEVENAVNSVGNSVRIRILDVDDAEDRVLAELVSTATVADRKKKPRRSGRGKGKFTLAEEAQQLRELAEEAALQQQSRPPIGITTVTEEEEAQDQSLAAEVRGERQRDAILIGDGDESATAEGGKRHRRRRRGRGRGTGAVQSPEIQESAAPPTQSASESSQDGDGGHRRRRRRRRRGRGGAARAEASAIGTPGDSAPRGPAVPDRHIFRVGADGQAQPTGTTAPREPSRAITPVYRSVPPAVEPPPPSLTLPVDPLQKTKPARRRRSTASSGVAGTLEATVRAALPPAPSEVSEGSATRRPRKRATATSATEIAPSKPAGKSSKPKAAVKVPASPAKAGRVKKTTTRKKTSSSAAGSRKKKT